MPRPKQVQQEQLPKSAREALKSAPSLRPDASVMWRYVAHPGDEGCRQIVRSWKPKFTITTLAADAWPEDTWFTAE